MTSVESKYDNRTITTIKNMYAKGATDDEFVVFITLCQKYDLDPMLNEIYFIKYGTGKPIMMTSRDGYLKIANRDPYFDGMVADVIYEGDNLTRHSRGDVMINYGENHNKFDNSKITGAFCNVYRKDRQYCSTVVVNFRDYYKPNEMWKKNPNAMILKVAEAMALKRAFAISGLVSKEEIEDNPKNTSEDAISETIPNQLDTNFELFISEEQLKVLFESINKLEKPDEAAEKVYERFNLRKFKHLAKSQFDEALKIIQEYK